MSEVARLVERTNKRQERLGKIVYPQHSKGNSDYTIIFTQCKLKPNCNHLWVVKYKGAIIGSGEERTLDDAQSEAYQVRKDHRDNQRGLH